MSAVPAARPILGGEGLNMLPIPVKPANLQRGRLPRGRLVRGLGLRRHPNGREQIVRAAVGAEFEASVRAVKRARNRLSPGANQTPIDRDDLTARRVTPTSLPVEQSPGHGGHHCCVYVSVITPLPCAPSGADLFATGLLCSTSRPPSMSTAAAVERQGRLGGLANNRDGLIALPTDQAGVTWCPSLPMFRRRT